VSHPAYDEIGVNYHWDDLNAGLAEMRRVARKRIVLLTIDAAKNAEVWTLAEYFPEAMALEEETMPCRWGEKHGHLSTLPELDIGTRLLSEEL